MRTILDIQITLFHSAVDSNNDTLYSGLVGVLGRRQVDLYRSISTRSIRRVYPTR